MNDTFTLTVELTSREAEIEIEVSVESHWENNGIGAYEYWGAKGFDKGTDYVVIDSTDYDKTGFSPEDIKEIEAAIEKELDTWAEKIAESNSNDEQDYEPEYDRD